MRRLRIFALPVMALLADLAFAPGAAPAEATIMALNLGTQPVNVSVGFNSQVPLADFSEATLAAAQRAGREYVYRLGRDECALLEEIIAKTCRLTHLNINTQIQQQRHNAAQPMLHINGNASFTISLKDEGAGADGE